MQPMRSTTLLRWSGRGTALRAFRSKYTVVTSIVGYAVAAIVESAALAAWGLDAGQR